MAGKRIFQPESELKVLNLILLTNQGINWLKKLIRYFFTEFGPKKVLYEKNFL